MLEEAGKDENRMTENTIWPPHFIAKISFLPREHETIQTEAAITL